jgi:hypothetical protein
MDTGRISRGGGRCRFKPERDVDHSLSTRAEVKNEPKYNNLYDTQEQLTFTFTFLTDS